MIDAAELKRLVDAWANRKVSEHVVSEFLMANLDAILALAEEKARLQADLKRLFRPPYCRDRMEEEGKPVYPRSCAACNDWEAKGCPLPPPPETNND